MKHPSLSAAPPRPPALPSAQPCAHGFLSGTEVQVRHPASDLCCLLWPSQLPVLLLQRSLELFWLQASCFPARPRCCAPQGGALRCFNICTLQWVCVALIQDFNRTGVWFPLQVWKCPAFLFSPRHLHMAAPALLAFESRQREIYIWTDIFDWIKMWLTLLRYSLYTIKFPLFSVYESMIFK